MKIDRLTIKGYRAIDEITIRLDKPLVPIIGINESGKSTILEAIMAFTTDNDEREEHLNPKNAYTGGTTAYISAQIIIETQEEYQDIQNVLSAGSGHKTIARIANVFTPEWNAGNRTIILQRELPSRVYHLFLVSDRNQVISSTSIIPSGAAIIESVTKRLPKLVYFEDFTRDIENRVTFIRVQDTPQEESKLQELSSLWQFVIREAFTRAGINFDALLNRIEQESDPDFDQWTTYGEDVDRISAELNNKLANEWWLMAGYEPNNPYEFQLQRNYSWGHSGDTITHRHTFRLRIVDSMDPSAKTPFNIEQRSKGYQWFCSFVFLLMYNTSYATQQSQAIFLIDEPGAYLHAIAQERLVDKLLEIAKTNQVIYTTHIPQLVNPFKIRLHDTWVAYRDGRKIALNKYGEMTDTRGIGALTTLQNAIKISLPGLAYPNPVNPFVITEGITDYYVFDMVKNYTALFNGFEISIIPGAGVDNLATLISLAIAWCDPYIVIFDKDEQGNKAIERYTRLFGEEQKAKYWIQLANTNNDSKVAIERLFNLADQEELLKITGATDIKRAFELLHFSEDAVKTEFWGKISQETKDNFSLVIEKIKTILSQADGSTPSA